MEKNLHMRLHFQTKQTFAIFQFLQCHGGLFFILICPYQLIIAMLDIHRLVTEQKKHNSDTKLIKLQNQTYCFYLFHRTKTLNSNISG